VVRRCAVAKPTKTCAELESMIANEVRRHAHCEGFRSISIHGIVDEAAGGAFNWAPSVAKSCDAALREIIPRLQRAPQ
jgi:hypothetical protein